MKHFPPSTNAEFVAPMTRCLYSQLQRQRFTPLTAFEPHLPLAADAKRPAAEVVLFDCSSALSWSDGDAGCVLRGSAGHEAGGRL